ncbi:MAG: LptF/LptG family permease [Fimbriimonadaceae bacterium]|nr:LptF/LptG family permease [Fimbriimonadaceae bacterium]QYK57023.1 MAG: LptF/LptG family permease [Fimbriimonadaceae bacterium]
MRELSVPLFIGTIVIALLFVANDMIALFKTFNLESIPPLAIIQLLLFKLPQWLSMTLPVGAALGASLAISRLARESEITAMRAAGVRVLRVFLPVLVCGAVVAACNFLVVDRLVPPAAKAYTRLINEVGLLGAAPQFRSNVVLEIDRFTASFGTVSRSDQGTILLTEILLIERPRQGETILYWAKSGEYKDGVWRILAPTIYHLRGTTLTAAETKKEVPINEPIRIADLFAPPTPDQETVASLQEAIRSRRAALQSTTALEIALQQKFAVPFSCLVFSLTGAVFAMLFARAGPFMGVLVSLGLVWLYFNLYVISGEIFGRNHWVSPMVAAWLPNLLYLFVGLILVRRLE